MPDAGLVSGTNQITEAQFTPSTRLYGVYDPAGTPQDVFIPIGGMLQGFYKIAPSVATNNLTLALTHMDGTDPTTTNPLIFRIGNSWQTIVATQSFTKNAGTNWCGLGSSELAALSHDLFPYLIQETGASAGTKFGFARHPYGRTMADFSSTGTSQYYMVGNYTNFNPTDEVLLLGRFRAQLSASAGFEWSIPSGVVINYPIYESDWLDWNPTYAGFSVNPTDTKHRYQVSHNRVTLFERENTNGTSNATTFTFTAPFTAKIITMTSGNYTWNSSGSIQDNGAGAVNPGLVRITSATNIVDVYKDMNVAAFTNSGGKRLSNITPLIYEI